MRSVMLPKTNVIVRPSVKTESFTAEMGPVFKIMPDKIFRPKSVNAWRGSKSHCRLFLFCKAG